jgi:hypothetical protein
MRFRPLVRRPLAACFALLATCAAAGAAADSYRDTPFKPDAEPEAPNSVKPGRKWQEEDFALPAWPRDADLIEIKLDGSNGPLTYYIDKRSLDTGSDGVVRYTIVAKSASGARNVSLEGLRCTPKGRWKTYAYGVDGRFTPAHMADDWQPIGPASGDQLHYDLWRHYLCVHRAFQPRTTRDQVRMLKTGRVPRVENAGFLTD